MEKIGDKISHITQKPAFQEKYQKQIEAVRADSDVMKFLQEHQDKLTEADVSKSLSRLYEFVTVKTQIKNGDKTLAPGYEPRLQLNGHRVEVAYVPTAQSLALKEIEQLKNRVTMLDLPKSMREASLNDFYPNNRREALLAAVNFVKEYTKHPHEFHKGMYLSGNFGAGKTYLLAAIANSLARRNVKTVMVHYPTFIVNIKNAIQDNKVVQMINSIKKAPILMLDDIGADQMTSWTRDEVLGVILQYRMQEELPVFFSSNIDMDNLVEGYLSINKNNEEEPLKAQRIMERIKFLVDEYHIEASDRRNNNY